MSPDPDPDRLRRLPRVSTAFFFSMMVLPMFRTPISQLIAVSLVWLQCTQLSFALQGDSGCKHSVCVSAIFEGDTITCWVSFFHYREFSQLIWQLCRWNDQFNEIYWLDGSVSWRSYLVLAATTFTMVMIRGFGAHMPNTHSVIMWHNQDGTTTLSQRYATGYTEPKPEDAPLRLATIAQPSALVVRIVWFT